MDMYRLRLLFALKFQHPGIINKKDENFSAEGVEDAEDVED